GETASVEHDRDRLDRHVLVRLRIAVAHLVRPPPVAPLRRRRSPSDTRGRPVRNPPRVRGNRSRQPAMRSARSIRPVRVVTPYAGVHATGHVETLATTTSAGTCTSTV